MRWRIVIITLLLILSGGAIVNVAVAWSLFTTNGLGKGSTLTYAEYRADIVIGAGCFKAIGYTRFGYGETLREDMPEKWSRVLCYNEREAQTLVEVIPYRNRSTGGVPLREFYEVSGFPMRSLDSSDINRRLDVSEIVMVGEYLLGRTSFRRYGLPYVPIFPGFLINTIFYAALLWLLFLAPFTARRMIRRRRGLCEKCAYPVGANSVCTECGAAVSRTSVHNH